MTDVRAIWRERLKVFEPTWLLPVKGSDVAELLDVLEATERDLADARRQLREWL